MRSGWRRPSGCSTAWYAATCCSMKASRCPGCRTLGDAARASPRGAPAPHPTEPAAADVQPRLNERELGQRMPPLGSLVEGADQRDERRYLLARLDFRWHEARALEDTVSGAKLFRHETILVQFERTPGTRQVVERAGRDCLLDPRLGKLVEQEQGAHRVVAPAAMA